MNKKPTLVYFNPDCFTQVDDTVLCHLTKVFNVIWFYLYDSLKAHSMRYNPEKAKVYAEEYGITLEIVDPQMRWRNLKNIPYYWNVAKRINSYHPDIVYACNIFPFWTLCYNRIKCRNKVLGIHDVSLHSYGNSLIKKWIQHNKEKWLERFKNIITFSPNQHDLLKLRLGKESTMVGMSYKNFGESTKTPGPIEKQVKLLFFGRIHPYKGLDLLIQSIERLKTEGVDNICLTIAGKGNSWDECKNLIQTPALYNLQIRFIDNEEIPDLMSSHHFLVLPYRDATQSGPLVAALGYGLPVLAPRFGCFTDVFNDENAILYQQGELTQALRQVSKMTQKEYEKLRKAVSTLREDYSEERIANNYIYAFKQIMYGSNQ